MKFTLALRAPCRSGTYGIHARVRPQLSQRINPLPRRRHPCHYHQHRHRHYYRDLLTCCFVCWVWSLASCLFLLRFVVRCVCAEET